MSNLARKARWAGVSALTLAFAATAFADTVTVSGEIVTTDPVFTNPQGAFGITDFNYDSYEFTVDADGTYGFYSFYEGDTGTDQNMDGMLLLYSDSFDDQSPSDNFVTFDDDYSSGDLAILAGIDGDAVGQNASGFEAALTAGTTYVVVQTTFSDSPTSFGQPTGPYDLTITGPGNISIVPAPAGLAVLGMAGLGLARRRRRG